MSVFSIEELPEDAIIDDETEILQATSVLEPPVRAIVERDEADQTPATDFEMLTLQDSGASSPLKRRHERQSVASSTGDAHINKTRRTETT